MCVFELDKEFIVLFYFKWLVLFESKLANINLLWKIVIWNNYISCAIFFCCFFKLMVVFRARWLVRIKLKNCCRGLVKLFWNFPRKLKLSIHLKRRSDFSNEISTQIKVYEETFSCLVNRTYGFYCNGTWNNVWNFFWYNLRWLDSCTIEIEYNAKGKRWLQLKWEEGYNQG